MVIPSNSIHANAAQMLDEHGMSAAFEINKKIDACRSRKDRDGADFWHKVYALCHQTARVL